MKTIFYTRPYSTLVSKNSPVRRIMPFIMPKRNESIVYFEHDIVVEDTLDFIRGMNGQRKQNITLFHVVLTALNKLMFLKPKLNRYLIGRRMYQRHKGLFSFAIKPRLLEKSELKTIKLILKEDDDLLGVSKIVKKAIEDKINEEVDPDEESISRFLKIPPLLLKSIIPLMKVMDLLNLLPDSMIKKDPFYTSAFVANLGSIGIEAPFHHLYEYGTSSIFVGFGRLKKIPIWDKKNNFARKKALTFRFSFDERIIDGFYCAKAIRLFERLIKNPRLLLNDCDVNKRAFLANDSNSLRAELI